MASSSQAFPGVQWDDRAVKACLPGHINKGRVFRDASVKDLMGSLIDTAKALQESGGQDAEVAELRALAVQVAEASHRVSHHVAALEALAAPGPDGYRADGTSTDFETLLASRVDSLVAAQPFDPASDAGLLEFDDNLGLEAAPTTEQVDDDVAIEGGSDTLAPNAVCPLTGKQLLELVEPVIDARGFVYEKAAAVEYVQMKNRTRPGQVVRCPQAGTSHALRVQDLRPADRVLAAKRRAERRGGTQANATAGGATDVLDV